jgi:hypothetical protein
MRRACAAATTVVDWSEYKPELFWSKTSRPHLAPQSLLLPPYRAPLATSVLDILSHRWCAMLPLQFDVMYLLNVMKQRHWIDLT